METSNLRTPKWLGFSIDQLFTVKIGKSIDGNKVDLVNGRTPYITRKERNNGLDGFIDYKDSSFLNSDYPVITIGNETATPFVQNFSFYSGTKVNILIPKTKLSRRSLLFIAESLRRHKQKYSYSYTINSTRLRRQVILLPVTDSGEPDFDYMESFILKRERVVVNKYARYLEEIMDSSNIPHVKPLQNKTSSETANSTTKSALVPQDSLPKLREVVWNSFYLTDIFEIKPGKRLTKAEMTPGNVPFLGASEANNGITAFVGNSNESEDSNVLGVNYNGSVVANFYHPYRCLFSDDVKRFKLKGREGNKYVYLFLKVALLQQKIKYSYGYKFNESRMNKQKILLPVDDDGKPDFDYMERYVKNVVVSKYRHFLSYKEIELK